MFALTGGRHQSASGHACAPTGLVGVLLALFAALSLVGMANSARGQNAAPVASFRDCPDCPEMVTIPAGTFMMGASKEEDHYFQRHADAFDRLRFKTSQVQPQHSVTISQPFALGKYPVTRGEFAQFIRQTGYVSSKSCMVHVKGDRAHWNGSWDNTIVFKQTDRDPVVCVSWVDANAYVAWLNSKTQASGSTGKSGAYRLPSEAEYEYAARGGTTTLRWWGNDIGHDKAVCGDNGCGSPWDGQQPAPVGSHGPNPFGVYDIPGNVWEWMQDCWNADYQHAPIDGSAWLTGDCGRRVERGGSWFSDVWSVTSYNRSSYEQTSRDDSNDTIGFRVAKSIQ